MTKCVVVQTKYGPIRVQASGALPASDIAALEDWVASVMRKRDKKRARLTKLPGLNQS